MFTRKIIPSCNCYAQIGPGRQDAHRHIDHEPGGQHYGKTDEARFQESFGLGDHLFAAGRNDIHQSRNRYACQGYPGQQTEENVYHYVAKSDNQIAKVASRLALSAARHQPPG